MKAALAELIGTFTLTFIGAGAGALAVASGAGLLGVAFAHGIALLVIVYTWGSVSGAHVNPAVTLGILLAGRMPAAKAVLYWIAQFIGAIIAAFVLRYLLSVTSGLGETIGSLTPHDGEPGDALKVIVLEAILTFFLVTAVFASGIHGRNGNMAGVAIGLVLTMDIIMGGMLTGASMNPARTFGPAFVASSSAANWGHLSYVWMYFVGPFIGGGVAGLLYDGLFLPAELQAPVDTAQGKRR